MTFHLSSYPKMFPFTNHESKQDGWPYATLLHIPTETRIHISSKWINEGESHINSALYFATSRFIHTDNDPSNLGLFAVESGGHGLLYT